MKGLMKSRKFKRLFQNALLGLIITIPVLMFFSIRWFLSVWNTMTVNELLYHLFSPLEGTGDSVIASYIIRCAVPALFVWVGLAIFLYFFDDKKKLKTIAILLASVLFVGDVIVFLGKIDFYHYIATIKKGSSFVEDNYVDPSDVNISFPEKKRNLVYIFLESMEISYSDKTHGGAFDYDIIPEMTELAREGENFSGDQDLLDGAYSLPGTDWTAAGIIAQTAGLPVQVLMGQRGEWADEVYYPSAVAIGDVLGQQGYRQYFLCGSDAEFGGRKQYLTCHGGYEIDDYNYAVERGWVNPEERDDWGFGDQKLFQFARERLTEISKETEPFNFTMLTVDTHFAGKVCDLCRNDFDSVTENVYACSNRQVVSFVRWIQEQDFYKNTTIVICGDHTTMDSHIGSIIDSGYNRKTFTLYLNAPLNAVSKANREYSTMDQFPTTLAALGAQIEGERLGLGTNLFSGIETRTEQIGVEKEKEELNTYSPFLAEFSGVDVSDIVESEEDELPRAKTKVMLDEENGIIKVTVSELEGDVRKLFYHIDVRYYCNGDRGDEKVIKMTKRDRDYFASIPIDGMDLSDLDLNIYYKEIRGDQYQIYGQNGDARLKLDDFNSYIDALKNYVDDGDCAVFMVAAKHNSMKAMDLTQLSKLRELGLKVDMDPGEFKSFCAVVDKDMVNEAISDKNASLKGTLNDGTLFDLSSNWRTEKINEDLLDIDGTNNIIDLTGLQIVVFNKQKHAISDFVCFDFDNGETVRRIEYMY